MKQRIFVALLLCFSVLLCACTPQTDDGGKSNNESSVSENHGGQPDTQTPPDDEISAGDDEVSDQNYPADLSVELVVEWEMADTVLSLLEDLSQLLYSAVEESGYRLDNVTLTISTAGAYTADSLVSGGIDLAILPSVDIIAYEDHAVILALSDDESAMTAIALSSALGDAGQDFGALLFHALGQTDAGRDFLSAFCAEVSFSQPTEERLQMVRDEWIELEKSQEEHP